MKPCITMCVLQDGIFSGIGVSTDFFLGLTALYQEINKGVTIGYGSNRAHVLWQSIQ